MSKTNYRLRDGDTVELRSHHKADHGYVYHADVDIGSYDNLHILSGTRGVVVRARTPSVLRGRGESLYFANVDMQAYPGITVRVRCGHEHLTVVRRGRLP